MGQGLTVDETKPIDGLVFDKLVYECLERGSVMGSSESMSICDIKKDTGLAEGAVLRAIAQIRSKGYVVISNKMEPMAEDKFRFPADSKEYGEWRDGLVNGIHGLIDLLGVCDAGAVKKWGEVARQETFKV